MLIYEINNFNPMYYVYIILNKSYKIVKILICVQCLLVLILGHNIYNSKKETKFFIITAIC